MIFRVASALPLCGALVISYPSIHHVLVDNFKNGSRSGFGFENTNGFPMPCHRLAVENAAFLEASFVTPTITLRDYVSHTIEFVDESLPQANDI
jgi:hypothetical protein